MALTTISAPRRVAARSLLAATESGMRRPGRNFSLIRVCVIDSQTSASCAHRRTRCVPLRPSTMAIPVPHAPPPMTAISLMWTPHTCGSRRKAGDGSGKTRPPRNVRDGDPVEQLRAQDHPHSHRSRSFQRVEEQGQSAECGRFSGYVGGSDVAAAGAAYVLAAEDADEEGAERDGAQEVAGGGDLEES